MAAQEFNNTYLRSDANLVAYWRFENTMNDEKSGYNLTDHSSTDTAGKFGRGRAFASASTQYCDITNAAGPNLETIGDQSIVCWVNPTTLALSSMVAKVNASVNDGRDLQITGATGTVALRSYKTGDDQSVTSSNALTSGVWNFVAVSYTSAGQNVKLFINGTVTTGTYSRAMVADTSSFAIGRLGSFAGQYYNGAIDDVAFFSRALTTAELTGLYNGTLVLGGSSLFSSI